MYLAFEVFQEREFQEMLAVFLSRFTDVYLAFWGVSDKSGVFLFGAFLNLWCAKHENDRHHENDKNDKNNSDNYKWGAKYWISGNHGNHGMTKTTGTRGANHPRVQTTGSRNNGFRNNLCFCLWEISSSYRYRLEGVFFNFFSAPLIRMIFLELGKSICTGDFSPIKLLCGTRHWYANSLPSVDTFIARTACFVVKLQEKCSKLVTCAEAFSGPLSHLSPMWKLCEHNFRAIFLHKKWGSRTIFAESPATQAGNVLRTILHNSLSQAHFSLNLRLCRTETLKTFSTPIDQWGFFPH